MGCRHSIPNSIGVFICLLCYFFRVSSFVFAAFHPVDNFLIDCGGGKPLQAEDGRTFEPDSGNSNMGLSVSPASRVVVSENITAPLNLYQTCRVFTETSTYTFRNKQVGRHWLRLHFYPIENPSYNLKSAVFSVVANGVTLLHEFSFADSGKRPSRLCKEFVTHVDVSSSKDLVLILSPSNASVAFINGIEVTSVPDGQFPSTALAIPTGPSVDFPAHVTLETVYRLNMGGPLVNPKNDSLWRAWEPDYPFLLNSASARNVSVDPSFVKYPAGVSVEIAPNVVYATAQEMADANVSDQRFNISWVFRVDGGFTYLIRLHFCDIVSQALNNLIFNVYINNQSALNPFDISNKTMELSAAYFVDFAADVSTGSDQILVQIGPPSLRNIPFNAILNGLEIMKISNSDGSLDVSSPPGFGSRRSKKKVVVLAVVTCVAGSAILALIAAAFYLHFHKSKKPKKHPTSAWLPLPTHVGHSESKVSTASYASTAPSLGLGRVLSFSEIREATKNFDENLVIGVGGFGKVYRGVLDNGVVVAIKRGNPRSQQGLTEFRTEIEMLSKLRHRHLVSLIGFCEELNEMILVYEFMAGGPLRKHLYGSDRPPLTWKQRLEICIGAAKGLHYLHTGAAESVIHRDVKTTNILLDENLIAKVADFGLSKLGPTLDQTHVSTAVKGSFGYLDPEYFRRQQLTEKSDVYSFGVVLMEVLCARPAINPTLPREQVNIAEWTMHWQKKGHLEKIIDPHLVGHVNLDSLRKFGETAEKCLSEYGIERPAMGDVLWNLEYALQLQAASLQTVADENSTNYIPELPEWIPHIEAADCDSADIVSDPGSDAATTSAVFSQLMNPRGR
ncbi:receptor-like protein kinase THESEUS 1 [Macadamia integrifolia]|uniref:receptor-like protein kinase THESEUS 1 n=1 Tax=Macadamia integrifolia TaxID=60698 RepID=UPI001C4F6C37|nr:receptor-like protein kinase THESEUS 1 [Macadamia integrifolia]